MLSVKGIPGILLNSRTRHWRESERESEREREREKEREREREYSKVLAIE